jgi:hypothetical protein
MLIWEIDKRLKIWALLGWRDVLRLKSPAELC